MMPIRRATRADVARALGAAWEAVRADRTRTRAALVALALSMAIVVCLTTLVERGRAATIRSLERAGLGNLYLVAPSESRADSRGAPLTRAEAEGIASIAPVRSVLALRMQRRAVTARGAPFSAPLYGVSGPLDKAFGARAESGRLLGDLDVARQSPYCVVGRDVAAAAGLPAPVGNLLLTGGRTYEVVGELAATSAEGATVGEIPSLDWNRAILVPLGAEPQPAAESALRYPIDLAVLTFPSAAEAGRTAEVLARMSPERYGPQGTVRVASPIQTLRQYKQARRTLDRIVWLVGLLTAAAAVLGISNLLSASVAARSKEIGLRRAVGARSNDIVLQFQAEGLLLGLWGGGLGLLSGVAISLATADRAAAGPSLSILSFSGLAGLCVVIGILTGIRPSRRASRIDPAQALREG